MSKKDQTWRKENACGGARPCSLSNFYPYVSVHDDIKKLVY